jgi:hypothetical protein
VAVVVVALALMVARGEVAVGLYRVRGKVVRVLRVLHLLVAQVGHQRWVIMAAQVVAVAQVGLLALLPLMAAPVLAEQLVIILWVIHLSLGPLLALVRAA